MLIILISYLIVFDLFHFKLTISVILIKNVKNAIFLNSDIITLLHLLRIKTNDYFYSVSCFILIDLH